MTWSGFNFKWTVLAIVLRIRTEGAKIKAMRPVWKLIE